MNEVRSFVKKIKTFYEKGIYSLAQVQALLTAGKITQEEYDYIVGANA